MAELSETQSRHANDVVTGNMAGLTRVIWSKWVDSNGKWQIDDLAER